MYLYENFLKVQLSGQENWQLISRGDKTAFEQAFKHYYQPLCNYVFSIIKDLDEAEEVVQTVFYTIWNKRENLDINVSLKSYLYRAAHNDCLNRLKHEKIKKNYAGDYIKTADRMGDDASKTLQAKELNKKIHDAIESLPEQCGVVFKLSRFDNLKYSEIAAQLDISVKTVENHMGKALKVLREKLRDYLPLIFIFLLIN